MSVETRIEELKARIANDAVNFVEFEVAGMYLGEYGKEIESIVREAEVELAQFVLHTLKLKGFGAVRQEIKRYLIEHKHPIA